MNKLFTLPNLISLYRLLMFPVILYFAIAGKERLFTIFLVINLVSDIIDGVIARRFHMESELGAKLDSLADDFNFILAFAGIFIFKMEEIRPHLVSFIIFICVLVSTVVVSLIKFRKLPGLHLLSTKIGGYIEGTFIVCLFTIGFWAPFYYFMIIWGMLGALESIVIQMLIPEMRVNVKGLYWVLKERKQRSGIRDQ